MIRMMRGSGGGLSARSGGGFRDRCGACPGGRAGGSRGIPSRHRGALLALVWAVTLGGGVFAQTGGLTSGQTGETAQGQTAAERPATERRRISANEAVDLAVRNNLSLEASRVSTATAKRNSSLRWNVFIPTVDLGAGLVRPNLATTVSGLAPVAIGPPPYMVMPYSVTVNPSWHLAASLQVSLNLNAAMFEQMRQTRLKYESGLISYERARAELERDVRKAYYQMLLLREQISLLRESYETAQRQAAMTLTNYRNGLVPEVSYLQAQVAVENLKPTMEQAENALRMSMASFANDLGLPVETEFELVPVDIRANYIPLDVAQLITASASGSPNIQELKQQILILQSTRRQTALNLYTPTITLSWNADPTFSGEFGKDNVFDRDRWGQQAGMFRFGLGLRLNSFLPFTTEGQGLKTIDDSLRTLNISLAQTIRGTELQVYQTVYTIEQARTSAEAQGHTVELAERTYREMERAYRQGASQLLEVQSAEIELRRARIGVLEQQFNYLKGLIDLEYAIGAPFGTLSSRENVR